VCRPLVVVSIVSIWLGMGSLHAIHIPASLSPFDWLRPLPGFRSMWVTGRYWGFLALPLSLLGAAALRRLALELADTRQLHAWMFAALLLQFGFQLDALVAPATNSRAYSPPDEMSWVAKDGEDIRYVYCRHQPQGALITPQQGVIDCYDDDDFTRADMRPGPDLVQAARDQTTDEPEVLTAKFMTWDNIRIRSASPPVDRTNEPSRVDVVLNQAYNKHWHSTDCNIAADAHGNMVASCDRGAILRHPLDLEFYDPVSALGARVSIEAWSGWLTAVLALLIFGSARRASLRGGVPRLATARKP
jgi:hypothetical protein